MTEEQYHYCKVGHGLRITVPKEERKRLKGLNQGDYVLLPKGVLKKAILKIKE